MERRKKEDERAEEQGPREIKVSWNDVGKHAKKVEKTMLEGSPRPSAWSFDGRIEKVGNDYIDVRSWGGTLKTFIIDETTEDFWKKQAISLVDLKKGMDAR